MTDKIKYDSVFCKTKDPYATVEWESRDSKIVNAKGETIFELSGIESPKSWSQMAVNVVASKYFYPNKEKSIKQIIDRIASTIAKYGLEDGYFDGKASADNFYKDLAWLMLHQHGSFNSPVWFNLGISEIYPEVMKESDKSGYYYDTKTESVLPVGKTYEKPQVSACFLQSVKDDMGSIMDLAKSEAMLFKHGSGTGTDLSSLRSSREEVSGGGEASGPLSFLRIYDTIAGVIRSAGRIRRSAKLNVLGVSHPDIKEWIHAKVNEEAKAKALVDAGYSSDFGGEAYSSVAFQNANLSVKITDDFMDAVKKDKKWATKLVSNPKKSGPVYKATEIFNWIAECAHKCGDPGVQFNDTMNQWHTCPVSAPCNTTNPCQPAFAKVTTPEGVVSFGSLKVGSVVWTGKGYTDVIRKIWTGVKPVYEYVTPAGSFVGTEDHKVISKGVRIKVKDADSIDNAVGNPNTSIEDVIYLGDYDVYDIEVADPEHVYATDNLIVSNCSEFVFVDNSACNLASLNLIKFKTEKDGQPDFDFDKFRSAVNVFATAQEIIIDRAAYPTQEITQNSHDFRPIGLGYGNLGALLMAYGLSYGSEAGRELAGVITSAMTAYAYSMSIELAKVKGAFKHFDLNKKEMIKVLKLHRKHAHKLHNKSHAAILDVWDSVIDQADSSGARHAQVTLLAPLGTTGFVMDCDTTGVEPDIALVKYKNLVGGGTVQLVNHTVPAALKTLGYSDEQIKVLTDYIIREGTIEGSTILKDEHLPVFDCALKPEKGKRFLTWEDHVYMMAAIQPFLSGAISKTVNIPSDATVDTIKEIYTAAWKEGVKGIAVYRDGCKGAQPLSTSRGSKKEEAVERVIRSRLPDTRNAVTHKFNVAGHEGYFTVGLYPDNTPGELFIIMSKEGSTIGGIMDAFGTAISMCLQYGVPLKTLVNKFMLTRFEPAGFTGNKEIPMATSIIDYLFRWLDLHYIKTIEGEIVEEKPEEVNKLESNNAMIDSKICDNCGSVTIRNGTCFKCPNCGNSLGCS